MTVKQLDDSAWMIRTSCSEDWWKWLFSKRARHFTKQMYTNEPLQITYMFQHWLFCIVWKYIWIHSNVISLFGWRFFEGLSLGFPMKICLPGFYFNCILWIPQALQGDHLHKNKSLHWHFLFRGLISHRIPICFYFLSIHCTILLQNYFDTFVADCSVLKISIKKHATYSITSIAPHSIIPLQNYTPAKILHLLKCICLCVLQRY